MKITSYYRIKSNNLFAYERNILILLIATFIFVSCDGSDGQNKAVVAVSNSKMYYTVNGNLVVVHNTPWGEKSYTLEELPPGALGGEGGIFVEGEQDPRIKILFFQNKGVVSVTVDGKKVPMKK